MYNITKANISGHLHVCREPEQPMAARWRLQNGQYTGKQLPMLAFFKRKATDDLDVCLESNVPEMMLVPVVIRA